MLRRSKIPRSWKNRIRSHSRSTVPFLVLDTQISDSISNHLKTSGHWSFEGTRRTLIFPLTTGFDGIRFDCRWNRPIQVDDGHRPDERVLRTRQQTRLQGTADKNIWVEDDPTPFPCPFRRFNRHAFVFQNNFVDRLVLPALENAHSSSFSDDARTELTPNRLHSWA